MTEIEMRIIELLKTYPSKKRQIEQLRFELGHPARIGEKEIIDSLSFGVRTGESLRNIGHISNKTMTIALQYQDTMQRMNSGIITDIMQELRTLEAEVDRLEHYISMLCVQHATTIRLLYFEQKTWAETEAEMNISKRTLLSYRKNALAELATMYSYINTVKGEYVAPSG